MGRRNLVEGASLSAYDAIFGGDDEEVIFSAIALFTLEWKYLIPISMTLLVLMALCVSLGLTF